METLSLLFYFLHIFVVNKYVPLHSLDSHASQHTEKDKKETFAKNAS